MSVWMTFWALYTAWVTIMALFFYGQAREQLVRIEYYRNLWVDGIQKRAQS